MKYTILVFISLCQLIFFNELIAQKKFGSLISDSSYERTIDIEVFHQYELRLKKGTIALLNITNFDVRTELTVVSPNGIILEQVNTAETADFLIFESPVDGNYQFYIKTIEGERNLGKYTITAHYIPAIKNGKLDQITELLQVLEKPSRAGFATAIIKEGEVLFEHYSGFSNVEDRIKNNGETVFELASVSKQFTAFAIAKLEEQGKLSVEEDIRKYFPELPVYKTPIKIKHLLNHTSGIIDSEYPLALAGFENDPIDIDRVINFLKNTPDQYFTSGSEFAYSNDGYTLLGELVHRVTKQTFRTWMKQNIFDSLRMDKTLIRDSPEIVIPNRATSYISYTGDTHFRRLSFDFYAPGGCSVRSSLEDLLKWVDYLNDGYRSQEKVFEIINTVEKFDNGDAMGYAYGNFVGDFRGLKRFNHLGLSAGFTTSLVRFPEENLGFIFLGNDGEFRNYYLARKIYEIYLDEKLTPKTEVFKGIETALPIKEELNSSKSTFQQLNLADYEGSYFSQQINTTYTFQVIKDTLFALSAAYKPIPIIAGTKDSLKTKEGLVIIFRRDYNGNVSECTFYAGNYGIEFTQIPVAKKWSKANYWKSPVFQQQLKDTLKKIESTKILTGFAVSVFDGSETFLQEGFGYANVENKKPYNKETVQLIASVSKSITAMAIMKAMEMGYFKLDDPINDYLPYKITNPNFPDVDITIRHLITHTSSLTDTENYRHSYVFRNSLEQKNWPQPHHPRLHLFNNNEKLPLSAFLDLIINPSSSWYNKDEMYTNQRPGTNYEYSNLGFALLGYIIETTANVDFMDFTQQHIFDPLEMESSTWELEKVDPQHHTTYYLENYKVCPNYSINTTPEGGLYTNIVDLTKFLQEAIRGYAGRGKILTHSSYKEMFKNQSDLYEINEGLGWDLSFPCCIGHAGNDFGVATVMYFQPSTGIGRIVFSNTSAETDEIDSTFYGIMNLLFLEE